MIVAEACRARWPFDTVCVRNANSSCRTEVSVICSLQSPLLDCSITTRSTAHNHGSRHLITAMPLSCTLDSAALLKILLHATKYPASPINGVLLGTATGGTGSQPAEDATSSLRIVDAVPLFHTYLHLAMPLETALLQVLL